MSDFHPYYILAKSNWGDYVGFYPENDPYVKGFEDGGETTLAHIINEWLWYNGGYRRCFNRFDIFLKIIPFMINDYHRKGALPIAIFQSVSNDALKRFRVVSVLHDEGYATGGEYQLPAIFDPDNFQAALVTEE